MPKKSIQKGWEWSKVKDLEYWQLPDGFLMNLPYKIGPPPAHVLDLGCGIGRHTVYFAAQGYHVSAIDIMEDAVYKTKEWLARENLEADVKLGKMTKLDYLDNHFDLVIAYNVIYHAFKFDIFKTLDEIFRVLKPGGYFFGTLLTKDRDEPFTKNLNEVVDDQTIIKQDDIEPGVPHFFSYYENILEFFEKFEIKELYCKQFFPPPYTLENLSVKRGGHFIFLVKKPE